jgi:hypothetical protein
VGSIPAILVMSLLMKKRVKKNHNKHFFNRYNFENLNGFRKKKI